LICAVASSTAGQSSTPDVEAAASMTANTIASDGACPIISVGWKSDMSGG
jgi:hypothetical protein